MTVSISRIFIRQYNLLESYIHIGRKSKPLVSCPVRKKRNQYKRLIKVKNHPRQQGLLNFFILNKK